MNENNKELLNDEALASVAGGKKEVVSEFDTKKKEFEDAWTKLGIAGKNISGMKRAELFDEWERAGYKPDVITFLSPIAADLI